MGEAVTSVTLQLLTKRTIDISRIRKGPRNKDHPAPSTGSIGDPSTFSGEQAPRERSQGLRNQPTNARRYSMFPTISSMHPTVKDSRRKSLEAGDSKETFARQEGSDPNGTSHRTEAREPRRTLLRTEAHDTRRASFRPEASDAMRRRSTHGVGLFNEALKRGRNSLEIARLTARWKMIEASRRKQSIPEEQQEEDEEDDIESETPPDVPRFCTRMSAEAQFALLKCYDDQLRQQLLQHGRVPPPRQATPGPQRLRAYRRATNRSIQSESEPILGHSVPRRPALDSKPLASAEAHARQLRVTARFRRVHRLLDECRAANDDMPRCGSKDPVSAYRSWSKNWVKDFLSPV